MLFLFSLSLFLNFLELNYVLGSWVMSYFLAEVFGAQALKQLQSFRRNSRNASNMMNFFLL